MSWRVLGAACDNDRMVARFIMAFSGGVVVGVAVQEVCWALADALLWATDLNAALLEGPDSFGLVWLLVVTGSAGGSAAGLFATLLASNRLAGYFAGLLLGLSGSALLLLAWPEAAGMSVIGLAPAVAAAAASWLGAWLVAHERRDNPPLSVITMAAG